MQENLVQVVVQLGGEALLGDWSLSIPAESYGEFEPLGVSDVAILAWSMFKTPKCTLP